MARQITAHMDYFPSELSSQEQIIVTAMGEAVIRYVTFCLITLKRKVKSALKLIKHMHRRHFNFKNYIESIKIDVTKKKRYKRMMFISDVQGREFG